MTDGQASDSASGNDGSSYHDVYRLVNGAWTLASTSVSANGSDQTQASDSGDESAGGTASAPADASVASATPTMPGSGTGFSDSIGTTDTANVQLTGDANGQTAGIDESTTENFADAQPALGSTPADSDSGSATFTLHRDVAYDSGGNATLQNAVLDVNGSYTDALGGAASFQIHVSGNPAAGFTTTVTETGTDVFANLNVTVTADAGWLSGFVGQIDQAIAARLGSTASTGDGNATNGQAPSTGGNTALTHDSGGVTEAQTLDAAGHVLSDVSTADATGALLYSVTDTYDSSGHKLSETVGTGGNARTTVWTYDTAGHQLSETVAANTAQAATTLYAWQGSNLISVTDPDGNVTRFGYDDRGNVVSMTDPLGHTETRTYDAQNRLASITNRDGQKRVLGYDDQGRLAQETWYAADGVTVTDVQTYTYDDQGRLQTATNYAGTYVFTYDAQGRLIRVDEPYGVWLAFGYDTFGHRTLVADSFGGTTASTYDKAGDLTDRSFSQDGTLVADLAKSFNDQGQLTGQARTSPGGAEIDTQYRYDFAGRVADILDQSGGATLAEFASAFDNAGDLASETDNGQAQQFAYDKQGQETSDGTGGAVQSFDGNGNRTTPGDVTGADNQLLSDGTWNYAYDADGNETAKVNVATGERWSYGYDARDHLVHAEERKADGTLEVSVDYKYDLFGNRLEKDVWDAALGLQVTKFAYDGWDPSKGSPVGNENWDVWADLNADGSLQTRYLRTDAVDAVFARIGATGSPEWYLTDRLGSIRDVVSAADQVEDAIAYDGYGNIITETNPAARGRYAWTGREYDVETDLQYNRARYYDATNGRWISQDPMGFDAGDSNLYRYVNNRLTIATDPSGDWSIVSWMNRTLFGSDDAVVNSGIVFGGGIPGYQPPAGLVQKGNAVAGPVVQLYKEEFEDLPAYKQTPNAIGNPGAAGSIVPIYGSGRTGVNALQNGQYLRGGIDLGLAGADLFALRAVAGTGFKAVTKGTAMILPRRAGIVAAQITDKEVSQAIRSIPRHYASTNPTIRFGNNANQTYHTFRHIVAAGMDQAAVQAAIQADILANSSAINAGLNVRSITVGGQRITYHAFQLPDGVINVGRITIP